MFSLLLSIVILSLSLFRFKTLRQFVLLLEVPPFARQGIAPDAPEQAREKYLNFIKKCVGRIYADINVTD